MPPQLPPPGWVITRTYSSERDYQTDAQAMAQAGWQMVAMGSRATGLGGGALAGIFAAFAVGAVCALCTLGPLGVGFIIGPGLLVIGLITVLILAFQPTTEITASYTRRS